MKNIILILTITLNLMTGCVDTEFNGQGSFTLGETEEAEDIVETFEVGELGQAGGVVIYTFADGKHGIELSLEPLKRNGSIKMNMGCHFEETSPKSDISVLGMAIGFTSLHIFDARKNTYRIAYPPLTPLLADCFDPQNPAQLALDFVHNGYDDWYIPTLTELYVAIWVAAPLLEAKNLCGMRHQCLASSQYDAGININFSTVFMTADKQTTLTWYYPSLESMLTVFSAYTPLTFHGADPLGFQNTRSIFENEDWDDTDPSSNGAITVLPVRYF